MLTERNQILVNDSCIDYDIIDTVYEICRDEFNSRADVHHSFQSARGRKSWARHYLLREIWTVCIREGYIVSHFHCLNIAQKVAEDWFDAKDKENAILQRS